ncbi:M37 protein [Murine cytomegalovirus (strain K181)]|uniref:Apoptosis inhibitor n=2 Tax=Muromegalovirus muridbeta1 TaxID=3050323 RepID=A2Q6L3_MUHVK|nr:apoptosis inhibitor [Murine cytomegalovirus (strain K181)]CAP08083.1 M37 protein [Murine cytomegalovirus (strain K181)]
MVLTHKSESRADSLVRMTAGGLGIAAVATRATTLCCCLAIAARTAVSGPESGVFECSYDVCLVQRKDNRTSVGCIVDCKYGSELVFSGSCQDAFTLVSTWFGKVNRRWSFRDIQLVDIGIAYYFTGYILRPLSSCPGLVSHRADGRTSSFSGKGRCHPDGRGSVELKTTMDGGFRLEVDSSKSIDTNWVSDDGNHTETVQFLMKNISLDVYVFRACPDLLRAVSVGHRSELSPGIMERTAVIRRDACSGGTATGNWSTVWGNWTKYCEMNERFVRDPGFLVAMHGYVAGDPLPKMVGMFFFVFGGLALLILFCFMTIRQRESLFKDMRGQSSLRLRNEDFAAENV